MDFGVGGLVGSDPDVKQKLYGSGFFKQLERPSSEDAGDDRGGSEKVAKLGDNDDHSFSVSASKAAAGAAAALLLPQRSSGNDLSSGAQQSQHLLCFSTSSALHSQKPEPQSPALPCLSSYPPSAYSNYAGLSGGNNMHGMVVGGGRGCFTPSQWMELEHQALIYKYIMANVPVPANLLIPIRKAFESTGFYYSTKLFRPNYGFHFGFAHRADLEPGRCRRTDGKKWRCSRDAVAEQKYCERHMNRGRHRSRKPVEGLSLNAGHPISGGATATTACVAATTPTANKPSLSIGSMMPNNCTSYNSFSHFQSGVLSLSDPSLNRRLYMNKETLVNDKIQISSPGFFIEYKSKATPYKESPLFKRGQNLGTLKDLTDQEPELNQSVGHYTNDYSSDATDLSISVTMASKDNNTLTLSPLISAYDQNHVHMNLGVGGEVTYNEHAKRQQQAMNWIPISWDSSMGDPLGEVLHNANSTNSSSTSDCKNSSVLNLVTGSWKGSSNSPLESSPTGVLKRTVYGSETNSSNASSPHEDENQQKLPEEHPTENDQV